IWHGPMADYRDYTRFSGRFISEFGMQAVPDLATVETFTAPADRYAESRVMDHHNKATDGPKRLGWYLTGNLRSTTDFEEYIYQTQWVQGEAVAAGVEGWRRRWSTPGNRLTAGALVWQINDCWPVTSWALVDSLLRPKAGYYRMKRALAPVNIGLACNPATGKTEVWIANNTLVPVTGELEIQILTLSGDCVDTRTQTLTLAENTVTEIGAFSVASGELISAGLITDGQVIARGVSWADLPKYASYPDPGLKLTWLDAGRVQLEVERPARGVVLQTSAAVKLSDNMLDLMPGDPQIIEVEGLDGAEITVRGLGLTVSPSFIPVS
ncbi:MAG TPA: glycoside hydrolase family 2 protein, partial [Phototrophicaceae bacterium]|nr:glycoside hydrolase family 2 protein [Phototrophicaceae bacterium]